MTLKESLKKIIFISLLLIFFLFSCKKDNEETNPVTTGVTISGMALKGPFKKGSDILINELNNDLTQTGICYATTTINNGGVFSFSNINISTPLAQITATGYYYMEPRDQFSPYKLSMEAIFDVQSGSIANVNILTHLIKPRIEKLVNDGIDFFSARRQAQNELKNFLHVPSTDSINFEKLDFTNSNFVFAASLLFQRRKVWPDQNYNFIYELNDLIVRFRNDFRDNGQINSRDIIDTLLYNANKIELIDDRVKMENFMATQGISTSIEGFDKYINAFQEAYSSQSYVNIVFPPTVVYDIDANNPSEYKNLLNDTSVNFQGRQYILSAIVPSDSSLEIKFTMLSPDSGSFNFFPYNYGWSKTNFTNGFDIIAQRKNFPNALVLWLTSTNGDSARVEYFKNNLSVPYFSKIIYW
jgi:hypothetical protein